jgi:hypothetical protein
LALLELRVGVGLVLGVLLLPSLPVVAFMLLGWLDMALDAAVWAKAKVMPPANAAAPRVVIKRVRFMGKLLRVGDGGSESVAGWTGRPDHLKPVSSAHRAASVRRHT